MRRHVEHSNTSSHARAAAIFTAAYMCLQTEVQAGDAVAQAVGRLKSSKSQAGAGRRLAPNVSIIRSVLDSATSEASAEVLAESDTLHTINQAHKAALCTRAVRMAHQMLQAASTVRCCSFHRHLHGQMPSSGVCGARPDLQLTQCVAHTAIIRPCKQRAGVQSAWERDTTAHWCARRQSVERPHRRQQPTLQCFRRHHEHCIAHGVDRRAWPSACVSGGR